MNEIKQRKIELNEDERNNTITKIENGKVSMIQNVIDRIYQFFDYKFLPDKHLNESKLPKWVGVSK